ATPSAVSRPRRRMRRLRVPAAALAIVALVAAAAAAVALVRRPRTAVPTFTRLTFRSEKFWRARFTPDGQTVYFAGHAPGDPGGRGLSGPFAAERGVPEPRRIDIANDLWLMSLSRTELWVASQARNTGMMLQRVPLTGGTPRPALLDIIEADVSPDGETMAAVHSEGGRYLLELPPGHVIYDSPRELMFPRLSPDGQRVAAIARRRHTDARGEIVVID